MPQNLPEQVLQRIVRLSADSNSQREVARMLGVSQGCISKILRRNRDWPTTSEEVWRLDENLHTTGRLSTAPNGQNEPLHLSSSSANADDLAIWEADCQFEHTQPFRDGFWPPDIGLGVQPDVLGSLGAQATSLWVGEEAQSVGPQTLETLYL